MIVVGLVSASEHARSKAEVVLPDPPFELANDITGIRFSFV